MTLQVQAKKDGVNTNTDFRVIPAGGMSNPRS